MQEQLPHLNSGILSYFKFTSYFTLEKPPLKVVKVAVMTEILQIAYNLLNYSSGCGSPHHTTEHHEFLHTHFFLTMMMRGNQNQTKPKNPLHENCKELTNK